MTYPRCAVCGASFDTIRDGLCRSCTATKPIRDRATLAARLRAADLDYSLATVDDPVPSLLTEAATAVEAMLDELEQARRALSDKENKVRMIAARADKAEKDLRRLETRHRNLQSRDQRNAETLAKYVRLREQWHTALERKDYDDAARIGDEISVLEPYLALAMSPSTL